MLLATAIKGLGEVVCALTIAAAIAYGGYQLANAPPQGTVVPPAPVIEVVQPAFDLMDQYPLLVRFPCEGPDGEDNTELLLALLWQHGWYIELPWVADTEPLMCGLSAFPPGKGPNNASLYS